MSYTTLDTVARVSPSPLSADFSPMWLEWLLPSDIERLTGHPLLLELDTPTVTRETVRALLAQHHHYSRYFTRCLCALISNLSDSSDVKSLAENLSEEMGFGSAGGQTHAELYQQSMKVVGVAPDTMPAFDSTQQLVNAMFGYCRGPEPMEGLAALCLGAEAIVPLIYRPIITGLKTLGFGDDAQHFFDLHVEEDEEHAIAMLRIMERLSGSNPALREKAIHIGTVMIGHRCVFLDGVWQHVRYLQNTQH